MDVETLQLVRGFGAVLVEGYDLEFIGFDLLRELVLDSVQTHNLFLIGFNRDLQILDVLQMVVDRVGQLLHVLAQISLPDPLNGDDGAEREGEED